MSDSTTEYRARLLGSDERDELWPEIVAVWPAYATYRQRSGRDIRVFSLRRVDDTPARDASDQIDVSS